MKTIFLRRSFEKFRVFALTGGIAVSTLGNAFADEPVHQVCGADGGIQIKIVGNLGDLVEVWDKGQRLYNSYQESRDQMGGKSGSLDCGDVKISGNIISIRMGWKNDLLQAYFLRRNGRGDVDRLQQLIWNERDGEKNAGIAGSDVLVTYGRLQDTRVRLCANYKGDGVWWFSPSPTKNGSFPGCSASSLNAPQVFGAKAMDIPR
jgi:hypothetical protein